MTTIKGAYTLVCALSKNAGNLLTLMLLYVTKSGGNLYFGWNALWYRDVLRIPGRWVQLCFQKSNWLYFKQSWLFPSICNPKPIVRCRVVGILETISTSRAEGREISWMNYPVRLFPHPLEHFNSLSVPSESFLVCKHPNVKNDCYHWLTQEQHLSHCSSDPSKRDKCPLNQNFST